MGLRSWVRRHQQRKIARYLAAHTDAALDVLRQDQTLALHTVQQAVDIQGMEAVHRQTMAYPVLSQIGFGGRQALAAALPKATPFNLRRFSEYPPARRAINAISNPILDLPWDIVPCDPTLEATKPETWPAAMRTRAQTIARCLKRPNATDTWRIMVEMLCEDICVGGYGALEIQTTSDPERPVWLWPVDGQSIRINVQWDEKPESPRYTQSLGYVGISVAMHDPVQLRDDELLYMRLNPRTNTPFGLGYLEVAFGSINAYIGAFDYAQRRASNSTPEFLLFLGENIDIPTTRQWSQYWQQLIEGYGKAPVIGGGKAPQVLPLRGGQRGNDPLWIKWQEWIVRQIAMAFGLSPMKLSIERDVNRGTAEVLAMGDWETSQPVAETIADGITAHVLHKVLGWDDLQFTWQLHSMDQLRESQILLNHWNSNAMTVDEQRMELGLPPLPDGRGAWTKVELVAQTTLGPLPALGQPEDGEETVSPAPGMDGPLARNGTAMPKEGWEDRDGSV